MVETVADGALALGDGRESAAPNMPDLREIGIIC
jgi:hypothetical protein